MELRAIYQDYVRIVQLIDNNDGLYDICDSNDNTHSPALHSDGFLLQNTDLNDRKLETIVKLAFNRLDSINT